MPASCANSPAVNGVTGNSNSGGVRKGVGRLSLVLTIATLRQCHNLKACDTLTAPLDYINDSQKDRPDADRDHLFATPHREAADEPLREIHGIVPSAGTIPTTPEVIRRPITSIQWADTTANPIMGCGGGELFPSPGNVLEAIAEAINAIDCLIKATSNNVKGICKHLVDDVFKHSQNPHPAHKPTVNTTNI